MNKFSRESKNSPNKAGSKPPRGSEVFVGKIPRDLKEQDLMPLFESVGRVIAMRLMFNRNGENRGFAFVTFADSANASKAIAKLNNFEIRPRQHIGVIRSLDNCRLFLGGIPKDKTEKDVFEEMSRLTIGIVRVIMYSSVADKSRNRGFAFVEYETHKAAAIARRNCISGNFQLWGKAVAVDWAEPEPVVDEETLSKVRILYVRNLLTSTKEEDLAALFNSASEDGVERVKILEDFAFVHFATRAQAEKALASLQNYELNGVRMQITWAKPMLRRSGQATSNPPDNGLHHSATAAIENLNLACGPPVNFGYSVTQQALPYLPFPALPYPSYQNPAMNHVTHEPMVPIHGIQGPLMDPNVIPMHLHEERRLPWVNPMVLNNMPQGLNHFYGFPAVPFTHHFQQLPNHCNIEFANANFNGIPYSRDKDFVEVQQLS